MGILEKQLNITPEGVAFAVRSTHCLLGLCSFRPSIANAFISANLAFNVNSSTGSNVSNLSKVLVNSWPTVGSRSASRTLALGLTRFYAALPFVRFLTTSVRSHFCQLFCEASHP